MSTADTLLEVRGLGKTFQERRGWPVPKTVAVRAIDGVSFDVARGEALGIVGESGSGKSVTAMSLMRLLEEPARIVSGSIHFQGRDVLAMTQVELRKLRGAGMAMVLKSRA